MQDKVQLEFRGISEIIGNSEIGIIVLFDKAETMQIAIVCDELMKRELQLRVKKKKECNTMLPEILSNMLTLQYGCKFQIIINDIVDGIYRAMIVNTETLQPVSLRAADAVMLHLITKAPLYATMRLMRRQAVPVVPGSPTMALPYNALSDSMLKHAMESAVEQEKYEMASTIRDELRKRGKEN